MQGAKFFKIIFAQRTLCRVFLTAAPELIDWCFQEYRSPWTQQFAIPVKRKCTTAKSDHGVALQRLGEAAQRPRLGLTIAILSMLSALAKNLGDGLPFVRLNFGIQIDEIPMQTAG